MAFNAFNAETTENDPMKWLDEMTWGIYVYIIRTTFLRKISTIQKGEKINGSSLIQIKVKQW